MDKPRFGIVVFPGSNCDADCRYAVETIVGARVVLIDHKETHLPAVDRLILPGGFSYGDYLRAGAIARASPIMKAIYAYAQEGGTVLGICNGFQILTEVGLLPGALLRNQALKFICRFVHVRMENNTTRFTSHYQKGDVLSLPIAHGEGNYYIDDAGLLALQKNNQIVFRYCDASGVLAEEANPNGSREHIAGICNKEGNVLGMMPHPERASDPMLGAIEGAKLFLSLCQNR